MQRRSRQTNLMCSAVIKLEVCGCNQFYQVKFIPLKLHWMLQAKQNLKTELIHYFNSFTIYFRVLEKSIAGSVQAFVSCSYSSLTDQIADSNRIYTRACPLINVAKFTPALSVTLARSAHHSVAGHLLHVAETSLTDVAGKPLMRSSSQGKG